MPKYLIASLMGFTGVALGAFGAHGLRATLAENGSASTWETAVFYHLIHAVASLWATGICPKALGSWLVGVIFFSGSLYVMALSAWRWVGFFTPVGGLLLLVGWVFVGMAKRK